MKTKDWIDNLTDARSYLLLIGLFLAGVQFDRPLTGAAGWCLCMAGKEYLKSFIAQIFYTLEKFNQRTGDVRRAPLMVSPNNDRIKPTNPYSI